MPPPPPPESRTEPRSPRRSLRRSIPSAEGEATDCRTADLAEPTIPADAKPIATEIGLASWYGPPYHNRRGSNGEVYNMHAMTAAHRTYPLGSIVRVTNVKTGSTALVRITDRGPFIPGRVLDLSLAAAHKLDVWKPGVAEVKVELMQSPALAGAPGKWAVQIGGFPDEPEASESRRPPHAPLSHGQGAAVCAVLQGTGGFASACSTTTTSAPRNSPRKRRLRKAQFSWFGSIKFGSISARLDYVRLD